MTSSPGVTRTSDCESSGHRTPEFAAWWATADRSAQQSIQEMRNAELKELVTRTAAHYEVCVGVSAADYPDVPAVNDGDTVRRVRWSFAEEHSTRSRYLETLRDYLQNVGELIEKAEQKLAP